MHLSPYPDSDMQGVETSRIHNAVVEKPLDCEIPKSLPKFSFPVTYEFNFVSVSSLLISQSESKSIRTFSLAHSPLSPRGIRTSSPALVVCSSVRVLSGLP